MRYHYQHRAEIEAVVQGADRHTALDTLCRMWAVILSGIVTATAQTLPETYAPDLPITEILAQIDVWMRALVMAGFGYAVRDHVL